jgi:proline dehydrogenase
MLSKFVAGSTKVIPKAVVRRVAQRYMAGETLKEALKTVRVLNAEGCVATLDVLGESTTTRKDAAETVAEYGRALEALDAHGLRSGISVKPTALGLNLDPHLCRENLEAVVARAGERGRFVRVDMENSPYTEATISVVLDARERHDNVGAVIQAYMRRSIKDVARLVEADVSARLCKGIYDEPREIAYKDPDTVRQNYVLLLEKLFKGGAYVGIATHDEYLVWHALRLVHELDLTKDRYEFQMLLGVDEQLRRILVEAGHKVRVYVPYGKQWYEYSTRRLNENPKIASYVAKDIVGAITETIKNDG